MTEEAQAGNPGCPSGGGGTADTTRRHGQTLKTPIGCLSASRRAGEQAGNGLVVAMVHDRAPAEGRPDQHNQSIPDE